MVPPSGLVVLREMTRVRAGDQGEGERPGEVERGNIKFRL